MMVPDACNQAAEVLSSLDEKSIFMDSRDIPPSGEKKANYRYPSCAPLVAPDCSRILRMRLQSNRKQIFPKMGYDR
jgi:hypothetical protein